MCSSVTLSTFTVLCKHHHHPSLELLTSCEMETLYQLNDSHFPLLSAPSKHSSTFFLYEFDYTKYQLFSTSSLTLLIFVCFSDRSHPDESEVICHCGFDLHLILSTFSCACWPFVCLVCRNIYSSSYHFLIRLFCFVLIYFIDYAITVVPFFLPFIPLHLIHPSPHHCPPP